MHGCQAGIVNTWSSKVGHANLFLSYQAIFTAVDWLIRIPSLAVQEGEDLAADSHQFVSSVCWSRKGHTLLAANSQGTLKLLELD